MTIRSRRAPIRAAALAFVIPLALSACGSSEEDQVKSTVNGLYDALAARDAGKVCGSLTESERRKLEVRAAQRRRRPTSCTATLGFAFAFAGNALKDVKNAKVTKVAVNGDKATAVAEYKGRSTSLGLIKQGSDWKISNLNLTSP